MFCLLVWFSYYYLATFRRMDVTIEHKVHNYIANECDKRH